MTDRNHETLLQEQIAYYRARAHEYDEWFLRQGHYDRGPELNRQWFSEVEQVHKALDQFAPAGRILELACGTGLWTEQLVRHAEHITAVDASPEMLAINQGRVGSSKVRHVQADLFKWRPDEQYNVVFFGFWLSHVLPERFHAFWDLVRSSLTPEGRVFFVDSLYNPTSTAIDHRLSEHQPTTLTRRLNDGRTFRIVKVFYEPDELTAKLNDLGWNIRVQTTANYFLYGAGRVRDQQTSKSVTHQVCG
jgi:demethylmenaquinone methyltransferase/2-methoxy-6-polyprenyl-1,4-benzoquinol methylase